MMQSGGPVVCALNSVLNLSSNSSKVGLRLSQRHTSTAAEPAVSIVVVPGFGLSETETTTDHVLAVTHGTHNNALSPRNPVSHYI